MKRRIYAINNPIAKALLLLGNRGAGWAPNCAWYDGDMPQAQIILTVNHEIIHLIQQIEFSPVKDEWTWRGYFKWLVAYLWEAITKERGKNKFEIDAYKHQHDINNRPPEAWRKV